MARSHDYLFGMRLRLSGGVALIRAYDGNHTDPKSGHMRIDAELSWRADDEGSFRCIFARGDTYCAVSRWTAIDGKEAKALVLSLFAVKPGDTDQDYFDNYTPVQLAWAESHGDDLSCEREARFGEGS